MAKHKKTMCTFFQPSAPKIQLLAAILVLTLLTFGVATTLLDMGECGIYPDPKGPNYNQTLCGLGSALLMLWIAWCFIPLLFIPLAGIFGLVIGSILWYYLISCVMVWLYKHRSKVRSYYKKLIKK